MDSMNTNYHNAFENATKNNEFSKDLFKTTKKSYMVKTEQLSTANYSSIE